MSDSWISDNFTEVERHKIAELHQREFQDMTPDEVALYARWESLKAVNSAEVQSQLDAITAVCSARIETMEELKLAAFDNLEAQRDAAVAWYDRVIGGVEVGEKS